MLGSTAHEESRELLSVAATEKDVLMNNGWEIAHYVNRTGTCYGYGDSGDNLYLGQHVASGMRPEGGREGRKHRKALARGQWDKKLPWAGPPGTSIF